MIIKLADKQVIEMGKLAILASIPAGMGYLHHKPNLKKEEINNLQITEGYNVGLFIDYYQGRMVKFRAWKQEDGNYKFPDDISHEYESWIYTYPSYKHLADAAIKNV